VFKLPILTYYQQCDKYFNKFKIETKIDCHLPITYANHYCSSLLLHWDPVAFLPPVGNVRTWLNVLHLQVDTSEKNYNSNRKGAQKWKISKENQDKKLAGGNLSNVRKTSLIYDDCGASRIATQLCVASRSVKTAVIRPTGRRSRKVEGGSVLSKTEAAISFAGSSRTCDQRLTKRHTAARSRTRVRGRGRSGAAKYVRSASRVRIDC